MRTKLEEAKATLKAVQDKLQKAPEGAPPADTQPLLLKALADVLAAMKDPEIAPATRRFEFPEAHEIPEGADAVYREAQLVARLPRDVQKEMDGCVIMAKLLKKPVKHLKSWKRLVQGSSELSEFRKAMDTAESGGGADWVPTGLSSELIRMVEVYGSIVPRHRVIPMPMPVYPLPAHIGRLTAYKASENTANTGQTGFTKSSVANTTGKITFTAAKLAAEVLTSKELEEDSIIPILPLLREELAACLARGEEEACLNGDTTATHMDSDTHAIGAADRRRLWKGFRKLANAGGWTVNFQGTGNSFNWETIVKVRAKLGKYGINPGSLYWITGISLFYQMLSLKDSNGNALVTTLDKMGPQATVKTGTLGVLGGSEIAVSEFVREDLNASGVYASGETNTVLHAVHAPAFAIGDRRHVTMQLLSELYAENDQDALIVTERKDFQPLYTGASDSIVASGLNIPLA